VFAESSCLHFVKLHQFFKTQNIPGTEMAAARLGLVSWFSINFWSQTEIFFKRPKEIKSIRSQFLKI